MNHRFESMIALALLLVATVVAGPKHPKLAADFESAIAGETLDVIVQYSEPITTSHIRSLGLHRGTHHKQTFPFIDSALVSVPVSELESLAADPKVVHITPDRKVEGNLDHATGAVNFQPLANYLLSIGQTKGAGVGIVVIDSGIAPGANFNAYKSTKVSRIVDAESFIDTDPVDRYGHGTHVAGIASGMDNVSMGIANFKHAYWGMAPDAYLISLKVLDSKGVGSDSAVIAAINRAIQLKSLHPEWNIRVMNLSLGRPVFESYKLDPLCLAVEKAWKAGIFVAVAAGNEGRNNSASNNGYGTILSPGSDPLVMTVGAVNGKTSYDRGSAVLTSYSSKGPTLIDHIVKPDIVAPGNRVVSYLATGGTLPTTYKGNAITTNAYDPNGSSTVLSPYYFTLSGTSMAAPLVSGLAAILIQHYPSLTPDQIKGLMMKNAWRGLPPVYVAVDPVTNTSYVETADIFTVGAGMLDAWATYQDLMTATLSKIPGGAGAAASPAAYYDSTSKSVKLNLNSTNSTSVAWGSSVSWGTSVIWGTNVSSSAVISGSGVVWGTSVSWGTSVLWGTTSPWASSTTPAGEASVVSINGEN